jgi:hypothetical protein
MNESAIASATRSARDVGGVYERQRRRSSERRVLHAQSRVRCTSRSQARRCDAERIERAPAELE